MNIVGAPSASEVDVNVEPDVYKCSWYNRIIKRPVDWGEFTRSVWGDQSLPRYRSQGTLHRCLFLAFLHDIQVATTFQFLFDWTENELMNTARPCFYFPVNLWLIWLFAINSFQTIIFFLPHWFLFTSTRSRYSLHFFISLLYLNNIYLYFHKIKNKLFACLYLVKSFLQLRGLDSRGHFLVSFKRRAP